MSSITAAEKGYEIKTYPPPDSGSSKNNVQQDHCLFEDSEAIGNTRNMLVQQPQDSPDDPLNWPRSRKMTILLVVSATAFLADFGSSMGAVTSVVQSNNL